jgi:endonuclease G, mitochondrial
MYNGVKMFRISAWVASVILLSSVAFAAQTSCPEHYAGKQAPEFINKKLSTKTQEVCYSGYGLMHSGVTRTPLYTSEKLTRLRLLQGKGLKRQSKFHPDDNIRPSERAELHHYGRSGYDRGHVAPSGDMYDVQSQFESFSLANMVPQEPSVNRGIWEGIESVVRKLAKERGELYVVTGPVFQGEDLKRLGGAVIVPSQMFKAVFDPSRKEAGAYLVNNEPGTTVTKLSVTELENLAGINIFPSLDQKTKERLMRLPDPKERKRRRGGR